MANDGIGAAVLRKEDKRFITGKGRFTDDIHLRGMTHAYFVRSPHAHARIKSVDTAEAASAPGVLGVLTGADLADDRIGGLICGWMINSKDSVALHRGNNRFAWGIFAHAGKTTPLHNRQLARDKGFQIHAGAECAAGSGNDRNAQLVTALQFIDRGGDAPGQGQVDRVLCVGAIQGDRQDTIGAFH
jgi:CO/xanthine dehydrogenase Mo-binding subunit